MIGKQLKGEKKMREKWFTLIELLIMNTCQIYIYLKS